MRHRVAVAIGAGVLVAAVAIVIAVLMSINSSGQPRALEPIQPSAQPTDEPSPTPSAQAPGLEPGEIIATITGEELDVYAAPGESDSTMTLGKWSAAAFQPLTLMAIDTADVDGERWLNVLLPVQPNGSTGWIKESEVTVTSTTKQIHIYLDERSLILTDGDTVILEATVAIGTDETPTPPGVYSVTDRLDYANPDHAYGAFALGMSGFSEVLDSFQGAPPQLAIHGTNQPNLIGDAVSNGCIRLPDEVILELAEYAELGTPVIVHETRASA